MSQHVLDWLQAFHDGELNAGRQQQVEKHLDDCPACRAELEALDNLSTLLKAGSAPGQTPPERFAAQVLLRLPRTSLPAATRAGQHLPRWVLGAPLGLIAAWAFLQAALLITSFLLGAGWLFGLQNLRMPFWMAQMGLIQTAGGLILLNVGLLVGTAIFWTVWLAFWWAWKNNRNLETA